jgi:hypothetical protein
MKKINLDPIIERACSDIYDLMVANDTPLGDVLHQIGSEWPDLAEIFENWYREGDESQ